MLSEKQARRMVAKSRRREFNALFAIMLGDCSEAAIAKHDTCKAELKARERTLMSIRLRLVNAAQEHAP